MYSCSQGQTKRKQRIQENWIADNGANEAVPHGILVERIETTSIEGNHVPGPTTTHNFGQSIVGDAEFWRVEAKMPLAPAP